MPEPSGASCPLADARDSASGVGGAVRPSRRQVGEEIAIPTVQTTHPYRVARDAVQRHEIRVAGASYVAPHFSRFDLAPGDAVVVRSPDGTRRWRYEGEGKPGLGRSVGFWGIHVPGDRVVIELHGNGDAGWGYRIDKVARGFPLGEEPPNPICGKDDRRAARCYATSHPSHYAQSRAVARLLIAGTGLCTGWLLGSEGHVMTNGHCITDAMEAANTDYEFMAEGMCGEACPTLQCPGVIASTSGTLVRRNYPDLDYALIRLDANPAVEYGYLKLRHAPAYLGETLYLPQHPSGKGKEVALHSTHPDDPTGYPQVQRIWPMDLVYLADIYYGSSGSPVLSHADHCVIALHSGTLGCDEPESGDDYIGNVGVKADRIIDDLDLDLPADAVADSGEACADRDAIFRDGFE